MNRADKYKADQQIEKMAADFLDTYFYKGFEGKANVVRYTDIEHQFGGVDLSINKVTFDEKVKVKGAFNSKVNCVGFECSFLNKGGHVQDGWLLNSNLSTDYYSIVSLSGTVADETLLTSVDQLSAADVLWVKKQDVIDMVEEKMPIETLKQDSDELREDDFLVETKKRKTYLHRKFWLTFSAWMYEKPVNLVVKRETLEQLPNTKHFVVTRNGVKKI